MGRMDNAECKGVQAGRQQPSLPQEYQHAIVLNVHRHKNTCMLVHFNRYWLTYYYTSSLPGTVTCFSNLSGCSSVFCSNLMLRGLAFMGPK